jgi:hypothetical protein
MNETIELALESPDGIIDCRMEPQEDDGSSYEATILYPNTVGGNTRSDIFCHNLTRDAATGSYVFEDSSDIHPKILRLESQLSAAIVNANKRK